MTMTIMTMMMMMRVVEEPTYLSVPRRRRLLPNQMNGISVAILDELEFLVISWKGGNGMDMYKSTRRKKEKEEENEEKKKRHGPWYFSRFAPNYLIGKDTHVGRDCRIWRIRLFL